MESCENVLLLISILLYDAGPSCQHYAGKTGPHFCAARYKFRSLNNFS
jgi:hypothetical protein